jgi:hypothetical protein
MDNSSNLDIYFNFAKYILHMGKSLECYALAHLPKQQTVLDSSLVFVLLDEKMRNLMVTGDTAFGTRTSIASLQAPESLVVQEPLLSIFRVLSWLIKVLRDIKESWGNLNGKDVKSSVVKFVSYEEIIKLRVDCKSSSPKKDACILQQERCSLKFLGNE